MFWQTVYKYLDKKTLSAVHFLLCPDVFAYLNVFFFQIVHFFTIISKVEILLCPSKYLEKLGSLDRIKLEKYENHNEYTHECKMFSLKSSFLCVF